MLEGGLCVEVLIAVTEVMGSKKYLTCGHAMGAKFLAVRAHKVNLPYC